MDVLLAIGTPLGICILALITGALTKMANIANDRTQRLPRRLNLLMAVMWGLFGSVVIIGNPDVAAFYFGMLLSWMIRYKLDTYVHGVGGTIILLAIFYVHPVTPVQLTITTSTFILFTFFGLLTRSKKAQKTILTNYNLYSCLLLAVLAVRYPEVWVVLFAIAGNMLGYQWVKTFWHSKKIPPIQPVKSAK